MLNELLLQEKSAILENWIKSIIRSYPAQSAVFLKQQSDRFRNPVGFTIEAETEKVLTELLTTGDEAIMAAGLDNIVRIRSVQDFSAAEAIEFVFGLKAVIHEALADKGGSAASLSEWRALEERIDRLALQAFDIFMKCRERMYDIKVNDYKRRTQRILQRAGVYDGTDGPGTADAPDARPGE